MSHGDQCNGKNEAQDKEDCVSLGGEGKLVKWQSSRDLKELEASRGGAIQTEETASAKALK